MKALKLFVAIITAGLYLTACSVAVQPSKSSEKAITAFSFAEFDRVAYGKITGTDITLKVPYQTDVSTLVAAFSTTGTSVSVDDIVQISGITANDFSSALTYLVTAEDGSTQEYIVTVTVALQPITRTELWQMIQNGEDVTNVNTVNINDMSNLFYDETTFNQDISGWDVSNVTDMSFMFSGASIFNQDISRWDVSNVHNMFSMFGRSIAFNQDISGWNVSNVNSMAYMFINAPAFNQDISNWNVGNVTDMNGMFNSASAFNQDISGWDVGSVSTMAGMFSNASTFDQNISNWNVRNVTEMSSMFNDASAFNQDISGWEVSAVTNMSSMFYNASTFNQNLSAWSNHVAQTIEHASFSNGDCPLTTENHPYASWD